MGMQLRGGRREASPWQHRSGLGKGLPVFALVALLAIAVVGSIAVLPALFHPSTSSSTSSTSGQVSLQQQNPPPFANPVYLMPSSNGTGECSVTVNGTFAGAPCFGSSIGDAVVFDCLAAAGTPEGCTTTVVSPANAAYDYALTIWYPYSSQNLTGVNCRYLPSVGYGTPLDAWCISTGPNSFIVSQPGSGPLHE